MTINEYYYMEENVFYYLEQSDEFIIRDNTLSELIGDEIVLKFLGGMDKPTTDLRFTKFWKSEGSVKRYLQYMPKKDKYIIKSLDLKSFMSLKFDDINIDITDYVVKRNIKHFEKEIKIGIKRGIIRSKYKAIDNYKPVPRNEYHRWNKCKKCGLKPIIWVFDNGSYTACGCGKNEYNHFSIESESIMSYLKRNDGSLLDYNSDGLLEEWNHYMNK